MGAARSAPDLRPTTGPAGHGGLALARRWCCCTAFPTTCTSTTACSPGCARHGSRHLRLPRLGSFRKPADYPYTAANQTGDLDAVLDQLGLNRMVLVAHDASGPPAIDRGPGSPPPHRGPGPSQHLLPLDAAPMAGHHNIAAAHRHHARDATQTLATLGLAPALLKTGLTRLSRSPGSQPPRRHSWPPSSEPPEQRESRRPGGNRPARRSRRRGRP